MSKTNRENTRVAFRLLRIKLSSKHLNANNVNMKFMSLLEESSVQRFAEIVIKAHVTTINLNSNTYDYLNEARCFNAELIK